MPDELFSTWLVRLSLAQGCDPMHLTGSLWPGWRAWTVDLDRGITAERMAVLSARSGVDVERLEEATLRPLLAAVAPSVRPSQSMWPWVLAQGSRNRRRNGGLQFCPSCLDEDATPYFRRAWRLVWHVGCLRHKTMLIDHCTRCQAVAEPHRVHANDVTLCKCPACGFDLRNATSVAEAACLEALAFQASADHVLSTGHGAWSSEMVSTEMWFGLARKHAGGRLLGLPSDPKPPSVTQLALNLQRPIERVQRMRMAWRGMNGLALGSPLLERGPKACVNSAAGPSTASKRRSKVQQSGLQQEAEQRALPPARPQIKVQAAWLRLLRRARVGYR